MLMASKFESYCKKCGRPIFEGDLIDYIKENKIVLCVCCHLGFEMERSCPHWALSISSTEFTPSNRYKYRYNSKSSFFCSVCGEKFEKISENNTTYIQYNTTHIRGKSPHHGFGITSFIKKGKYNQTNNPDEKSLQALQRIIEDERTTEQQRDIAFNHIIRINEYNKTLIIEIEDLIPNIKNDNDKGVYLWFKNKGILGITKSVSDFLYEAFECNTSRIKELMDDLSKLDIESLSLFIMVATMGYIVSIVERNTNREDNLLSKEISILLVEFISNNTYEYSLINAVRNLYPILGITFDFYELLKKFFLSQAEMLKDKINIHLLGN